MKNTAIGIVCQYFLPPLLITLILFIIAIFLMAKGAVKRGGCLLGALLICWLCIAFLPIPAKWFYRDWNNELNKYELLGTGDFTCVYAHPEDENKVIKQISAPGVLNNDMSYIHVLPTLFTTCTRDKCTLPCLMVHKFVTGLMWLTLERMREMDSKFFPHIYEMDRTRERIVCDRIEHKLNESSCPVDYEEQLRQFPYVVMSRKVRCMAWWRKALVVVSLSLSSHAAKKRRARRGHATCAHSRAVFFSGSSLSTCFFCAYMLSDHSHPSYSNAIKEDIEGDGRPR